MSPLKGDTIGGSRERSASRIRARMPEHVGEKRIFVIKTEKSELRSLPELLPGGELNYLLYHPVTGAVVINKWNEIKSSGSEIEYDPDRYLTFGADTGDLGRINLSQVPKSWSVAELIPQVIPTIERALVQQDQIIKDHAAKDGVEQVQVEVLLAATVGLSECFVAGDVSEEDLDNYTQQAEAVFIQEGLISPRDDFRPQLIESVKKACELDSIHRVNPLMSQMRLYSAYLNAVRRETSVRLTRAKAETIYGALLLVRNNTRYHAASAVHEFERLLRYKIFEKNRGRERKFSSINDYSITLLRRDLQDVLDNHNKQVTVAPYLAQSALAERIIGTFYNRRRQIELDEILKYAYLGNLEYGLSAEEFLMRRQPGLAAMNLNLAARALKAVLEDPDNTVIRA